MGFIAGNKMAIVENCLAGGPAKKSPLKCVPVVQTLVPLLPQQRAQGEAGAGSPPLLPGEQPRAAFACFALSWSAAVHPGLRAVKKHQQLSFSTDLKNSLWWSGRRGQFLQQPGA